jgi:hypothetical protein
MYRIAALVIVLATLLATSVGAQATWSTIYGPVTDFPTAANHIGTDGTSLYVVFGNNTFYKYVFNAATPTTGKWTELATPPRSVIGQDSYSDLSYQAGYLYTSALANTGGPTVGRAVLRYSITENTWEVWQNDGVDINGSMTSGNGIFMDPTQSGVGYSAWHAGNRWVKFDWNNKTYDNEWISPPSVVWMSRNEDIATNGAGTYYSTGNDLTVGLSSGDIIYKWTGLTKGTATSTLIRKPWQNGVGQSIEFIPGQIAPSGHDELWLIRGTDGAADLPGECSCNGTSDWAWLDLTNTGAGWKTGTLPGTVVLSGEAVLINGSVFVRGKDAAWYVTKLRKTQPLSAGQTKS